MTTRRPEASRPDGRADRPGLDAWLLLAILCFVAGAITLIVTWYKISGLALVAEQLPYLASGGLGGLALIIAGAGCLSAGRSARIEARLIDLLTLATEPIGGVAQVGPDAGAAAADTATTDTATTDTAATAADAVLTVAGGTTYHRPGCRLVAGKEANSIELPQAIAQGLTPCPVCH